MGPDEDSNQQGADSGKPKENGHSTTNGTLAPAPVKARKGNSTTVPPVVHPSNTLPNEKIVYRLVLTGGKLRPEFKQEYS